MQGTEREQGTKIKYLEEGLQNAAKLEKLNEVVMNLDSKADTKVLQKLEDKLDYDYMNSEAIEKIKRELEHNMDTLTSRLEGAAPAREVNNLGNKMEKMFQK